MCYKITNNRPCGFILITVLLVIALLSVLLLEFNYESRRAVYAANNYKLADQARYCSRSGLNIAIAALAKNSNLDTNDFLRQLAQENKPIALSDGSCTISVTDEGGKINVNLLKKPDGSLDQPCIEQLLRCIDSLSRHAQGNTMIDYSIVPALIDWVDTDDEITYLPFIRDRNQGAESSYYQSLETPYLCGNHPLTALDELLLVKGFRTAISNPSLDNSPSGCGGSLDNFLTVYGSGKININHADARVIESLSDSITSGLAQLIVNRRLKEPFTSTAQLRDIPGMTDAIYSSISEYITTESDQKFYTVIARGVAGSAQCTIKAVLGINHADKYVEIINYREL